MLRYPLAVTIDTNIFDAIKYDFSDGSPITLLENYVQKGKVNVVLSDIVVRESKKHIAEQISKVCGIVRKRRTEILKESTEHLIDYLGLNGLLELIKDKKELMDKSGELFEKFVKDINAEILSTDLINLDTIIDDYFEIRPPFEEGEKKRKEFPDAFIACQIRERFGEDEMVAIISNDNGFKKACERIPNHIFFDSLSHLYDTINKEEATYNETINIIKDLQFRITSNLLEYIKHHENIDVRGRSYDKDGIESGFDYSEFYLQNISNVLFRVHSVDEMSENTSIVTLLCDAKISVDCYYEDYDKAAWDSEIKDYIFLDTIKIREEHTARFTCRIELDRESKTFKFFPFTIILGGDSRKNRYEIKETPYIDYEQEIEDMDRASLGFTPLGSYESYLEEDLPDSDMSKEIIGQFEEINKLHRKFEDFSMCYDSLNEQIGSDNANEIIKLILKDLEEVSDFPGVVDMENISEDEIEEIKRWLEDKSERAYEIAEEDSLPDTLYFGESITIKGVDNSEIVFTIDEIAISPSEGTEETIDIYLSNEHEKIADGRIKLLVGYLEFDEDGGVGNGVADSIEYEYYEITNKINDYILEQNQIVEKESQIVGIIKNALKVCE